MKGILIIIFIFFLLSCGDLGRKYRERKSLNIDTLVTTPIKKEPIKNLKTYYFVAGSFSNETNAISYVSDLKKEFRTVKWLNGYYRVVLDSTNNEDNISFIKNKLVSNGFSDILIIKKY